MRHRNEPPRRGLAPRILIWVAAVATVLVFGTPASSPAPERPAVLAAPAPTTPAQQVRFVPRSIRELGIAATGVSRVSQAVLTHAVEAAIVGRVGGVSAAVYDARTGQLWSFREGPAFSTASIVKLEIVAATLLRAQREKRPLTAAEAGYARAAITYSDNDSATRLFDSLGVAAMQRSNDAMGLKGTIIDYRWGLTTTTARDQVGLLNQIVYPIAGTRPLLDRTSRATLVGLLAQVIPEHRWGVSAGPLDDGAEVWLKNGWRPTVDGTWQVNSIGHVSGAHRDYTIAVLTDANPSELAGHELIEAVSRAVWRTLARPLDAPVRATRARSPVN